MKAIHYNQHPYYGKGRTTCGRDTRRVVTTDDKSKVTCKICAGGGVATVRKKHFDSKFENQLEYFKQ